jgi:hypothetical protein
MADAGNPTSSPLGNVTTPGAGAAITGATITTAADGNFDIDVYASYGAVGDVPDNFQLSLPAGSIPAGPLPVSAQGGPNSAMAKTTYRRVFIKAGTLTLQAVAAAAAGCVYRGFVVITPVY